MRSPLPKIAVSTVGAIPADCFFDAGDRLGGRGVLAFAAGARLACLPPVPLPPAGADPPAHAGDSNPAVSPATNHRWIHVAPTCVGISKFRTSAGRLFLAGYRRVWWLLALSAGVSRCERHPVARKKKLDPQVEDLFIRLLGDKREPPEVRQVLKLAVDRAQALLDGKRLRRPRPTTIRLTREQRRYLRRVADAMDERADDTYPLDVSHAAHEVYLSLYHLLGIERPKPKKEPPWPKNRPLPF